MCQSRATGLPASDQKVFSNTVPTRTFPACVDHLSLLGRFLLQWIVCSEVCILPFLHWVCSLSQYLQVLFILPFYVCRVLLKMSPSAYFNFPARESKHCWCQKCLVAKTSVFRTIVLDILFLGELESEIILTKKRKTYVPCAFLSICLNL